LNNIFEVFIECGKEAGHTRKDIICIGQKTIECVVDMAQVLAQ